MGTIDHTKLREVLVRAKERVEDTRDWNDIVGGDEIALDRLVSDLDNAIQNVSDKKEEDLLSPESLMDIRRKEITIVRECNRVLGVMLANLKGVSSVLPFKDDVKILKTGLANPGNWWRVNIHDHNCQKLEEPLVEVAAWDGLEPDSNCNCSVSFPVKWLSMTNEELNELFNKGAL